MRFFTFAWMILMLMAMGSALRTDRVFAIFFGVMAGLFSIAFVMLTFRREWNRVDEWLAEE